jgi:hypothetical protein
MKLFDFFSRLKRKSKNKDVLLISDELLSGYGGYGLINRSLIAKRLKSFFPDAEIILFIRSQTEMIQSLYNQQVKLGWFRYGLDERFITKPGIGMTLKDLNNLSNWDLKRRYFNHQSLYNIEHFKYSHLIEFYKKTFDKIHVILYEDFLSDNSSTINRLNKILKVSQSKFLCKTGITVKHNVKLNDELIPRKVIKNNLEPLLSNRASLLNKFILELFNYLNRSFIKTLKYKNEKYLQDIIECSGFSKDNLQINDKYQLGMEKHIGKYF